MQSNNVASVCVAVVALATASPALAWDCTRHTAVGPAACDPDCMWWPGNSMEFRFNGGDFSSAEKTAIQDAAGRWEAGTGKRLRGADWHFTFDWDSWPMEFQNGLNEIGRVEFTSEALKNVGLPKSARKKALNGESHAVTIDDLSNWPSCSGVLERDIFFDASNPATTSPTLDGEYWDVYDDTTDEPITYVGVVAAHEFGHAIGFTHHAPDVNLMDGFGNNNAEFHELPSPDEDNLVGLQAIKPHSSTGVNVAVSPWSTPNPQKYYPADDTVEVPPPAREALSGVEAAAEPQDLPQGTELDLAAATGIGFGAPRFLSLSTSGTGWFPVEFWLVPASSVSEGFTPPFSSCQTYTGGYLYSQRSMNLGVGTSYYRMAKVPGSFTETLPVGDYRVCVEVDPDSTKTLSETDTTDNVWVFDRTIRVIVE